MNPSSGIFISMDSYQGSIYDPVTLHKYLYANANPVMYTDPSGYKTKLVELVVAVGILGILANSMAFNNQVSLNIFSSMRRNTVDATLEQTCTVSAGDWKNTILDFPAHHFDTRWIVTTVTWMLSWQLFETIYATEEDTSSIPGVPAKEQDDNTAPSGIPAEVQNGPTIEQSNGKKLLTGKQADEAAAKLGYSKTNYRSHGQPVYKKKNHYISPDVDCHSGGTWKMADSVKNLDSKTTRMGTYDAELNRIGD